MHSNLMPEGYIAVALLFVLVFGSIIVLIILPLFSNEEEDNVELPAEQVLYSSLQLIDLKKLNKASRKPRRKHGRSRRFGTLMCLALLIGVSWTGTVSCSIIPMFHCSPTGPQASTKLCWPPPNP